MQNLFDEVSSLDRRCYEEFYLSEDVLMEHAANGMASYIRDNFSKKSRVLIVSGGGNNGADGAALARLLHLDFNVFLLYAKEPSSNMAKLQQKRARALGIKELDKLQECDVVVDAVMGSGFCGELDVRLLTLLSEMNSLDCFKIACDIPSAFAFKADITLTMGALKKEMFNDWAKDKVGEIKVLSLGINRDIYEKQSNWMLLDLEDLKLPHRAKRDSHKGSYGHLAVASGQMSGAGILSAMAALRFGSGLVTLVGFEKIEIPHSLLYSHEIPKNTTALALGMGLGSEFSKIELDKFLDNSLPLVADADVFHMRTILEILKRENIVLTPHAKEFVSLLKITELANISVEELQKNRFKYVEIFCKKFPHVVLLLKGANCIIGMGEKFFINPHGSAILAKGGSGDVLSGLIGSLLSQGSSALDAAINGSLAHVKLALNYGGADFSLTPDDLIDEISKL